MTGAEILNEYVVASPWAFSWLTFGIIMGVFVIYGIFGLIVMMKPKYLVFSVIIGVLLGSLCGGIVGCISPAGDDAITRYEVVIDDTVSMNDFYEKYEIIEQKARFLLWRKESNDF